MTAPSRLAASEPSTAPSLRRKGGASLPRIPALDGLRAIAVIAVVVGHTFATVTSDRVELYDRLLSLSLRVVIPYAIDLFFVISGYLITAILYETRNANNPIRTFYARRALRIVPIYYTYLLISHLLINPPQTSAFGTGGPLIELLFLTNIAMMSGLKAVGWVNAHFWTVAIEEQFYFLWPLAVIFAPAKRLLWICLGLVIGSFVARAILTHIGLGHIGWLFSLTRLDGLIAGGMVALLQRRNPEILKRWAKRVFVVMATIVVPALLLIVLFGVRRQPGTLLDTFNNGIRGRDIEIVWVPLVAAIFFSSATALLVMKNTGREPILTSPRLLRIAEASYGMYIFHIPVLIMVVAFHVTRIFERWDVLNQIITALITIFFSYLVGHFTWNHFEKRFVRMAPVYKYPQPTDNAAPTS